MSSLTSAQNLALLLQYIANIHYLSSLQGNYTVLSVANVVRISDHA